MNKSKYIKHMEDRIFKKYKNKETGEIVKARQLKKISSLDMGGNQMNKKSFAQPQIPIKHTKK